MTPNHKQMWCDALPVKMRLLGWSEEACRAATEQAHKVRQVYTGRSWHAYTKDVGLFLSMTHHPRTPQVLVAHFPRRSGVDRSLNITA